ncbi:MAG: polysaccharide ABC transporter ATP-binding protein [Terriglobales bacterium]
MSETAIRVEKIGKQYRLGERQRYYTLRDTLARALSAPFRSSNRNGSNSRQDNNGWLWALRDVSFEIKRGELVGIIGRNGAGKSTLLKVLSRITMPTEGVAEMHGRVGSLLEVGTGFHPELTGRENIYMNGAVLGMRRAEIARKFDEIVAFAETEKFLDTPVKFYSSGMYMRLAFAVAAHMETEILVVDEVLAVGDAAFQKKCLGKMGEVRSAGRTVLFVSHNMNAIEQLCQRVILLDSGHVKADSSEIRSVITGYLFGLDGSENSSAWVNDGSRFNDPHFRPIRLALVDGNGEELRMPVRNDSDIWVEIEGEIERADPALTVGYGIFNEEGQLLYWSCQTDEAQCYWPEITAGILKLRSKVPNRMLNEGSYRIEFLASLHFREWLVTPGEDAPHVQLVIQGGVSDSPHWVVKRPGILAPVLRWERVKELSSAVSTKNSKYLD